jgi:hypothetical protein
MLLLIVLAVIILSLLIALILQSCLFDIAEQSYSSNTS